MSSPVLWLNLGCPCVPVLWLNLGCPCVPVLWLNLGCPCVPVLWLNLGCPCVPVLWLNLGCPCVPVLWLNLGCPCVPVLWLNLGCPCVPVLWLNLGCPCVPVLWLNLGCPCVPVLLLALQGCTGQWSETEKLAGAEAHTPHLKNPRLPGLGHSRDAGAAPAALGIPSQPGIPGFCMLCPSLPPGSECLVLQVPFGSRVCRGFSGLSCCFLSPQVQIQNKKVDLSKVSSKCGSKANIKHKPGRSFAISSFESFKHTPGLGLEYPARVPAGGGDVKIENQKLNFKEKAQAKVGSLDNVGHSPAGGAVKIESHKLTFRAKAKARTDHGAELVFCRLWDADKSPPHSLGCFNC
uniref:Microtubule-associated protein n=1 Tax=Ficedula albicollis TaxID=59894 RepID=A0A803VAR5_FICAL